MSASDADSVSANVSVVAADHRAKARANTAERVALSMAVFDVAVSAYLRSRLSGGHVGFPAKYAKRLRPRVNEEFMVDVPFITSATPHRGVII